MLFSLRPYLTRHLDIIVKKHFVALAISLSSTAAMANTGIINFQGTVTTGGTCPIEVVHPGGPSQPIHLGHFRSRDFTAADQNTAMVPFSLRITPDASCNIDPTKKAFVKFSPRFGADPSGKLYALQSGVGYTSNLALEILDRSSTQLPPETESKAHDLDENLPTDMHFTARLKTTEDSVPEGRIDTSVDFLVDIR